MRVQDQLNGFLSKKTVNLQLNGIVLKEKPNMVVWKSFIQKTTCTNVYRLGRRAPALGWSEDIFFIGQNRSSNQRSGMILEVQIQNFSASQNFHFQQIPGGLNIDIFWWKLAWSFTNNRCTNVLLVGIFENAYKKGIDRQKCYFGRFWQLITFLCFKKYWPK